MMQSELHTPTIPGQRRRPVLALLGLVLLTVGLLPISVRAEIPKKPIHILNLRNIYIGFNEKDAQLTYQVIMSNLVGDKYSRYEVFLQFPETILDVEKAILANRCDIVTATSTDYIHMRKRLPLEPLVIFSKSSQSMDSYLFLAPAGRSFDLLSRKADRTLIVELGGGGEMARIWLSTLLMEKGCGPVTTFFNTIRLAKPSRAILPVFFDQADACIVAESAYRVMTDLNPQIKQKISVLERSPGFVNLLICATKNLDPEDKKRVKEELSTLSEEREGQQALTIMQMNGVFPFKPEYIKATENLFHRHQRLMELQN